MGLLKIGVFVGYFYNTLGKKVKNILHVNRENRFPSLLGESQLILVALDHVGYPVESVFSCFPQIKV